jgi:hypothetical protein
MSTTTTAQSQRVRAVHGLVCVNELDSSFPYALQTLYNGRSKWTWLTRTGPDGRAGRRLWMDVRAFNFWAACRGIKYRLELSTDVAIQGGTPR